MSLKNIILKIGAASIAVSILFSNCSMFGLGLSKVIAENIQAPKIEANLTSQKYVQYQTEEYSGVALQTELEVNSIQEQEGYLPISSTNLEVELPNINGYLPERASVVKASTEATTGEKENTRINQNYDSNSGLLTVSYENTKNNDGNIYTEFKKDAKDKFEIIYIYPAEAYTGNEEEVALQYTVNAKMAFKTENEKITSEKTKSFELKEKENKGDITTFNVTELKENIYKGFMYSNVENKTNYNTEYKTVSTLCVLNSQFVNETTMKLEESEFVLNDEEKTEVTTNGKVIYKSTGISKAEFDKILGQDGSLEIYNGETLLATVKYIEVEENKKTVKKLAVLYSEENVKVLSDEETSAIVEYKEDVTALTIKTSKPIAEGFMNFENQNTIKATKDYGVDVKNIKYIRTATNVNTYNSKTDIQLSEPETKISVNSSNTNFSTLKTTKTTLTIKLDDTNASTKLFDNPTITIKLPNGLTGGKLSSPEILNGNGLSIKSAKADNNVITIELEGKQTSYDLNNVSGGVNIVMDIENIDFNDKTPTHKDKIEVDCVQGSNKVTTSCDVNINSKFGLLMLTKVNNGQETYTTLDNNIIKMEIEEGKNSKIIEEEIIFVNNYNENLKDVHIIGALTSEDSTFAVKLAKDIEVNNSDAKVYYSENFNASFDDNSWKENYTEETKLYKVVLNNNELISKDNLIVRISLQVPEKLQYNAISNINTKVDYIYADKLITDVNIIEMETSKLESINTNLYVNRSDILVGVVTTAGGLEINDGDEVNEGQILKSKVTLINNSSEDVTYKLKTTINNAVYYELYETGQIYNQEGDPETRYGKAEQGDVNREYEVRIPAASTKDIEYQYAVNYDVENVTNNICVVDGNNNVIDEIKIENIVKDAKMELLVEYAYNEERVAYSTLNAILHIKNLKSKTLKNVDVEVNLSEGVSPSSFEYYGDKNIELTYDDIKNVLNINIDKISENENVEILVIFDVDIDTSVRESIVHINSVCDYDETIYRSNNFSKKVYQDKTDLSMNITNNVADNIVNVGDKIQYTVNISNKGSLDLENAEMRFRPANGIVVNNAKVIYADGTEELIEIDSNPGVNKELIIKKIDNITIIYDATVEYTTETMESTFILTDGYFNSIDETSTLTGIIEEDIPEKNEGNTEDEGGGMPEGSEQPTIPDDLVDPEEPIDPETPGDQEPTNPEGPENPEQPEEPIDPETPGEEQPEELYTISGSVWLDANKDGKRDEDEALQQNVVVSLVDMNKGNFALDANGNVIKTTTDAKGKYTFNNIAKATYAVLFEFDTNKYTVATYQKEGIAQEINSDAILSTVTINGVDKKAGLTDKIKLTSNEENIDLGIIENATFDLSLDKEITKITVVDKQGTKEYEYKDGHTAKVDLVAKYMNGANVIVNYKFTITNNGDTVGYVDSLVDNLPSGLEFSSELNKDWYKGSDGQLYTTSLSGIAIKPGETSEVELILTKNMTENNTGTFVNNAELEKTSNLENIQEKEEARENNKSSAILILSIKTGSVMLYIGITTICLAIIGVGVYFIKKKVLNRGI